MTASGGGDLAEDVNGGMQKLLLDLDWQRNVNIVFHICDAPAHNNIYHDLKKTNGNDKYFNGATEDVPF